MLISVWTPCWLFALVSGLFQAPTRTPPATGGIARSVAPTAADRHAETLELTVVCATPEGEPLAGVEVTCFEIDTWTTEERAKATLKTDAAGTCRFDGVKVPLADVSRVLRGGFDTFCVVTAKTARRASVIRTLNEGGFPQLQHINGSKAWMKLVMEPAYTLRGRVTNSKGEPVEGAFVYTDGKSISRMPIEGCCSAKTNKNGEYKIVDLMECVRPKDAGQVRIVARGKNTVTGERVPNRFLVYVWHPDYGQKLAQGNELPGELNLVLPEAGIISGRALDAATSKPLPGAIVRAGSQPKGNSFRELYCTSWTITDSNGVYRLGLRAGNDYRVFAGAEGFIAKGSPPIRDLAAHKVTIVDDITLDRAGVVRAYVIDAATKQRIRFSERPDLSVELRTQPKGSEKDQIYPASFSPGGAFLLRAAIPGRTYSISVESSDPTIFPRPGVTAFNVKPGETVEVDLPVDITKPRVTGDNGR